MLEESLNRLDTWLERNGWAGYDPYDIKGTKLFIYLQRNRYTNFSSNYVLNQHPMFFRRLFRVRKQVNAKAMALFARAYLALYKKRNAPKYLEKGLYCLNWLLENQSKGYSGHCWGYPFHWQSRIFIPKGTPSGVVTSTSAHAFLDAYELLGEQKYIDVANSCCSFILSDLNRDETGNDEACFSYTPLDHFHVHNANLFSASVLLRTFAHTGEENCRRSAVSAMNFTVRDQNEDGSWYYWGPPERPFKSIDNYHTGFVLECLNIGRRALGNEFHHTKALRRGLEFYANNLFLEDGTPKLLNDSVYPIDIHSCSQGIITFSELADFEPRCTSMARKVAEWTVGHMQDKEGCFYYRIGENRRVDKTAYIRWGQAWMIRALSYLV
jgi:hypothetical protein